MIHSLFAILFPSRCFGCRAPHTSLCKRCVALSRKSLTTPHPFITSTFDFKDPLVKRTIHAIKYYHRKDLILPLTEALAQDLLNLPITKSTVLIPIPMPYIRKLLRGYNQAEIIADTLGKLLDLPVQKDILRRVKTPTRQVKLHTRNERLKNQKGSFEASDIVAGGNFILIDDVATTGATLEEARAVLLRRGAASVRAATLAH